MNRYGYKFRHGKVFCSHCRWLLYPGAPGKGGCSYTKNTVENDSWFEPAYSYIEAPAELNKSNDCEHFTPTNCDREYYEVIEDGKKKV